MIFKPNPLFISGLEGEAALDALLDSKAAEAKSEAEAAAPDVTGYYKGKFKITKLTGRRRLGNLDPFAHLTEWGSANNEPYSPLRRGVAAAGLHLREDPKP
jgi:hypothetical protein